MSSTLILIPPSEGKQPGGKGSALYQCPEWPPARIKDIRPMIDRLQAFKGDMGVLLGVKGKALAQALEANQNILNAPTMPAIERYSGVVYDGIDYPSLSSPAKNFFDEHIRIISALFGCLSPRDPIPQYKLGIEKLDADKYWKPKITAQLKDYFVIDLLPQVHQKAVGYERGVNVDFVIEKNGKRIPAGHQGKMIKGRFVRWLCAHRVQDVRGFRDFCEDGFQWNDRVFLKKGNS